MEEVNSINFLTNSKMLAIKRLRAINAQIFVEIGLMHLSRAMDLEGEGFATLFTQLAHKEIKTKKDKLREKKGIMSGAPLTHEGICTIYQLIEYISEDFNVRQENTFRKAGNQARQFQLRFMLNNATPLDLNSQVYNVHDCCCVLKNFLGDMPEPLLSSTLFEAHLKLADESEKKRNRLTAVQILLLLLPFENYVLLQNLLTMLQKVAKHHKENLMGAENLAIIFTPLILCPRELSAQELQALITKAIPVLTFMIKNAHKLFQVPKELLTDVEKHLNDIQSGEMERNDPIKSSVAYCQRHTPNHVYTTQQVEGLLTDIHNMPDCQQKKIFLKRYKDQKGRLTPASPYPSNENGRRTRSHSVGESLKKLLTRSVKKKIPLEGRRSVSCERLQTSFTRAIDEVKPASKLSIPECDSLTAHTKF